MSRRSVEACAISPTLLVNVFSRSIPSSSTNWCPRVLYATVSATVCLWARWMLSARLNVWWMEQPVKAELAWFQLRPAVTGLMPT